VLCADAAVVDVSTTGVTGTANAALELNRLFDMEKALVLDLFGSLGIQLTPAERQALDQRPTQNLQAFLAWSRGLEAEDNGDFSGAQQLYDQATRLDPGFLSAQQSSAKASDMSAASVTSVSSVEAAVTQNANVESGTSGNSSQGTALNNASGGVTPQSTAPTTDPTTTTTTTTITAPTGTKTQSEAPLGPPTPQSPPGVIILKIPRP
jgi:CCR4-NOT transcriptional regulation complex NOT5 subunit